MVLVIALPMQTLKVLFRTQHSVRCFRSWHLSLQLTSSFRSCCFYASDSLRGNRPHTWDLHEPRPDFPAFLWIVFAHFAILTSHRRLWWNSSGSPLTKLHCIRYNDQPTVLWSFLLKDYTPIIVTIFFWPLSFLFPTQQFSMVKKTILM